MSDSEDVEDVLSRLNSGDDVVITTVQDGEEQEITAHVTDAYHEPPERDSYGWIDGELDVHLDATDETVERLDLPTYSVGIMARIKRPGEWNHLGLTVWDPDVDENGTVTEDGYTSLGDIQDVEVETDA